MRSTKNGENLRTGSKSRAVVFLILTAVFLAAWLYCRIYYPVAITVRLVFLAAGIAALVVGGLNLLRACGWKPAGVLLKILAVLIAAGFVYFIAVEIVIVSNERTQPGRADYIIVLGAGVDGTVPSLALQYRLNAALDYLLANPGTVAVVSGGQGVHELITEADCMYNWLTDKGIAPERIIREDRSTSTKENITFSMRLIGEGDYKIGIVSAEYHLYRAKQIAKKCGVKAPITISAKTELPWLRANYTIREAFAVTALWVLG